MKSNYLKGKQLQNLSSNHRPRKDAEKAKQICWIAPQRCSAGIAQFFSKHIQWNVQRKSMGMKRKGILVTWQQISILVTANMLSWIIINIQERPGKVHYKGFVSIHLSPIKPCHAPTNESQEGLRAQRYY